jgi:hypothetical protein
MKPPCLVITHSWNFLNLVINYLLKPRVRRFAKIFYRFKVKRSETRSVSHAFRTLTWKNIFFFASFRFEFFASGQSDINRAYFRFVLLPKFFRFRFVSLPIFSFRFKAKRNKRFFALFSLNFIFVWLQMRKQAKITLFSHRSGNILLPLRFEAKMMAFFRFCFASFIFEAKMMAVFRFFFVLFSLRSIFVPLQISTFRIDAK